jgi:ABC-type phosphate transport system substrate-binding protein
MMRFGSRLVLAAALVCGAGVFTPYSAFAQSAGDLAIVAHPGTPISQLSFTELRQVLKGDRQYWTPDLPVVLFVRAPTSAERSAVLDVIYQMSEPQFKQYWIAKQFRAETATSPKNMRSNDLTQQFVASTPGAIGFMAANDVKPGVKVLKIEGRLPGEAGYKLHLTAVRK